MAVINQYIDENLAVHEKQEPNRAGGSRALINNYCFNVANTDSNGSVYRLNRIESNAVIYECLVGSSGITGGTSYHLGLYNVDMGDVVDADLYMSGQSLVTAKKDIDGISAIPVAKLNLRVWELLGLPKDPQCQFDLAITANTAGTSGGDIAVRVLYAKY